MTLFSAELRAQLGDDIPGSIARAVRGNPLLAKVGRKRHAPRKNARVIELDAARLARVEAFERLMDVERRYG